MYLDLEGILDKGELLYPKKKWSRILYSVKEVFRLISEELQLIKLKKQQLQRQDYTQIPIFNEIEKVEKLKII